MHIPQELSAIALPVDPEIQSQIKSAVSKITNYPDFPLSEPTRLTSSLLTLLKSHDYLVSEMGTGLRCLLFLTNNAQSGPATFMLLRDKPTIFYLNSLHFPLVNNPTNFHHETLVDGEIVQFSDTEALAGKLKFVAFDLLAINGVSMMQRSLSTRLGILHQDVIKPFLPQSSPQIICSMRKMERSYGLQKFTSSPHKGLIFTAVKSGYVPSRDPQNTLLELRYINTYNFLIRVRKDINLKVQYELHVSTNQTHKFYETLTIDQNLAHEYYILNT